MRVYWTDHARQRLRDIEQYIAADSTDVARRVVRRLLLRSRQIGELPRSGRQVPEYQREDLREVLERPFRIIYRVRTDRIEVLTIMHYRQLLPLDLDNI